MKICNDCGENKPLEEFNWRSKAKGTKQPYCRACQRKRNNKDYKSNKSRFSKTKAKYRQSIRDLIWKHRHGVCAEDGCEISDPHMLEFDHVDDNKEFNIGEAVAAGYGKDKILAEIEKCELVCSNHHRVRTAVRGGYVRNMSVEATVAAGHAEALDNTIET